MPDDDLTERLRAATELLEAVARDRAPLDGLSDAERARFLTAAGDVFSPDVEHRRQLAKARRRRARAEKLQRDEEVLAGTGIRSLRAKPVFTTPNVFPPALTATGPADAVGGPADGPSNEGTSGATVADERHCYVCKTHYRQVHRFYDQLCPPCGALNERKRTETADLSGRVALLTGGRVKIGYQAGIKLLRAGADLIVTTRFPRDSALRYAAEADFGDWGHRLEIYGLDLRHTPSVEALCQHLATSRDRLDFIVNNACQTVRRPPAFYRHMMELESGPLAAMPDHARRLLGGVDGLRAPELLEGATDLLGPAADTLDGLGPAGTGGGTATSSAELSQAALLPDDHATPAHLFPEGRLDQDLQQVDLRGRNSWRLTLAEVSSVELLETQLVNAVAPFVLNARLKPLLTRTPERDKHIVNVSAVEGQFYRRFKTTRHPHTNMAKAALNMMTRTSAADYHADGIHMDPAHPPARRVTLKVVPDLPREWVDHQGDRDMASTWHRDMASTELRRHAHRYVTGRLQARVTRPETATNERRILGYFCSAMGARRPDRIGQADVERWLGSMAHLAPGTVRGRFAIVRRFCAWLVDTGVIRRSPMRLMTAPKVPRSRHRNLTAEQATAIVATATHPRDRVIAVLGFQLGVRRAELAAMAVGDFTWGRRPQVLVHGKGGHERVVPLTVEAVSAVERYLASAPAHGGPLIRGDKYPARGVSPDWIGRAFARVAYDAGVKLAAGDGVSTHAMRHTCATDVHEATGDVLAVQQLLGHQSLATTQGYVAGLGIEHLRTAMEGRSYGATTAQAA